MSGAESGSRMGSLVKDPFIDTVGLELKRAERYRIFVSLIVLDLATVEGLMSEEDEPIDGLLDLVATNIRTIDRAAVIGRRILALLLPETPRQGAEVTARRLSDLIRKSMAETTNRPCDQVIPLEMASFPDAAGTKTISEFLHDLSDPRWN